MAGPLRGLKTIEMGGLGPAPFCAMLLTDMGAEIVRIERPGGAALISHRFDVTARGREMLELDLRQPRMIHSRSSSNLPVAAISTLTQTATNTGVYKCKTAQGKTEYSDLPCAGAANTQLTDHIKHRESQCSGARHIRARSSGAKGF
jgi:hypothetical protein